MRKQSTRSNRCGRPALYEQAVNASIAKICNYQVSDAIHLRS